MNLKTSGRRLGQVLAVAAMTALLPAMAWGQADTCNGLVTVDYISGPNFAVVGDVLRVQLNLGTGSITGGTHVTIQRLKFNLDCNDNFPLGLPCTDEGLMVEYEGDGTITSTCPGVVGFSSSNAPNSTLPNQVVFTPNVPIVIPANQSVGYCHIEFDVKVVNAPSIDSTPNFIEETSGYTNLDAICDNLVLASGGQQSSAIPLCPTCTPTECTTSACNQTTGQCVSTNKQDSTPCGDTDQNLCTTAGCEGGQCVQTHIQTPCPPDTNDCTDDLGCNPATGLCQHPPKPDSTPCAETDGNLCTTAGCEAGQCVQTHIQTPCPADTNECTDDLGCNPATGLCQHPPKPNSTPCTDSDSNACTHAGCEQGQCVQTHQTDVCSPSNNQCLRDLPCNPVTGSCDHPGVTDNTPCGPDTDGNPCTTPACESGVCVQSAIQNGCVQPDHFACYEILPTKFTPVDNVSLVDQFGPSLTTVNKPHYLCAPSDKKNEFPGAPTHPDHLTAYLLRGKPVKKLNQTVTNQFGTVVLDVVKPSQLLVPTAKSLTAPAPAAPTTPAVDHFQCYKVKRSKGSPKFTKITGIPIKDQFGTGTIDLLKPTDLCAPVDKNGEDPTAQNHVFHLLCYRSRGAAPFGTKQVWLGTQFGPLNGVSLSHRPRFCVPSIKNNQGPPTTTTTSSTTTTTVGSPSGAFLEEPRDLLD
jgi:hypothetical protein